MDGAHYHFLNAVRLRPDLGETQNNLATTLLTRSQVFAQRGDQAMADPEVTTLQLHCYTFKHGRNGNILGKDIVVPIIIPAKSDKKAMELIIQG